MGFNNSGFLVHSRWTTPGQTAAAATAFTQGVPPFRGQPGSPCPILGTEKTIAAGTAAGTFPGLVNTFGGGKATVNKNPNLTVVTRLRYNTANTAHKLSIMRPLNWTTVAVAGAINTTTFTLTSNPGLYSTSYNYPVGGGLTAPGNVADLTFSTTHYYCVQLSDGTWFFDLCAGFNTTTLVVTTTATIPNVTGGGIPAGSIFYMFGSATTANPQDGFTPPSFYTNLVASGTAGEDLISGGNGTGELSGYFPNDPLLFYSPNTTGAGLLACFQGYYSG